MIVSMPDASYPVIDAKDNWRAIWAYCAGLNAMRRRIVNHTAVVLPFPTHTEN